MVDIKVSALPSDSARVVRWLAAPGGLVAAGAPLVIVVTERAEVLLPAPVAGALVDPVPVGATVEPGALLARIMPAAADVPRVDRYGPDAHPPLRATPLARRIAKAYGVDLGTVTGTGPGGRIDAADVKGLALAPSLRPSWKRAERALTEASRASAHGSERSERSRKRQPWSS